MKKIMFNDKYGLTKAVLEGRKTMTRRIIKTPRTMEGKDVYGFSVVKYPRTGVPIEVMALDADGAQINNILPKYKVGEIVAVAQAYRDIRDIVGDVHDGKSIKFMPGWSNKMFVRADLMHHHIRITNVRVERLQDIGDEDCLRDGVCRKIDAHKNPTRFCGFKGTQKLWFSPREAFAALIDKISGKGTWESNPWVFVYEFELVNKEDEQ